MQIKKILILSLTVFAGYLFFSCQPALGSSWYKRSIKDGGDKKTLTVQSITVCGVKLYPEANGEDFIGKVNAKDAIVYPDDISVAVKDDTGAAVEVSIAIKGPGGQANLKEGEPVTVPIMLKTIDGSNLEIQKYLFLEQDGSMGGGGADYNPKDPHGNSKFIIKIKTEYMEADPWVYYKEGEPDSSDDGNFDSSKFDNWILNMPSMDGIVASYKFREGSWSGSPEMVDNVPSGIGSGLKRIWDVKVYRYKNRKDRWAEIGYTPAIDPKDERFHFFKFTASSAGGAVGGKHGSSMFCVDRYSKFLFYYSEPTKIKSVFGNAVPEDWTDYAAPTEGQHTQFSEPFYMTDPVGFVKEDGSVVLYQWIKDNINNADYHPKQNPAYTQPAGRKANKVGFSPYREKLKITKKTIAKDKNPKYTAVKPVILEQPKDGYAKLNSPELVFEVKTEPVPDGETLSYQWYKAESKTEAGTAIPDATESSYKITDTSTETKCYFYCIVKNTNTDNNKSEQTESERAKCHITDGQIQSDALNPEITEQPKSKTLRLNSTEQLTLRVKAKSKDDGTLSYQWYKAASPVAEGTAVTDADKAEYTFTPDTSAAGITYYYCLVTNTNNTVQGEQSASKKSTYAAIEVEQSYKIDFFVDGDGGALTALHNGNPIKSGDYVKKGEKVKFIAAPKPRHIVKAWEGVTPEASIADKTYAVLTVGAANAAVSVSFEPKMRLTITPKISNESLESWSTEGNDHFSPNYIGGVHISRKCAVQVSGGSNVAKLWDYMFPVKNNSGKWIQVQSEDFIKVGKDKSAGPNWLKAEFSSFSDLKMSFSNYLIKANRHDYWWAEWTTGFWPVPAPTMYPLQAIDNNSIFPLVYNETTGMWTVDKANVNIKRSDDIPLPAEFAGTKPKPDRKISYKGVTITYDENFILRDGEEKDFVVTYKVDNHDETRSKGTVKVVYTISWK